MGDHQLSTNLVQDPAGLSKTPTTCQSIDICANIILLQLSVRPFQPVTKFLRDPFLKCVVSIGHCPNCFRPPTLCQMGKHVKKCSNHLGKPLHPPGKSGQK